MNIHIGYDSAQDIAYSVCRHSIIKNTCNKDICIRKISCDNVAGYNRPHDPLASTPFTYARFYIPFVNDYKGCSIFCDGDFLFLDDIQKLSDQFDPQYAVQVVKHDYTPSNAVKMNDKPQSIYPRKNWSSLILWNNEHPKNRILDCNLLNNATGSFLHRFQWLDDADIGEISYEWNWLVGWYTATNAILPKALHFTEGGPWLDGYKNCEYSDIWFDYKNEI
jgi:lipopolysaccharide biosynthesis glycosyltransferase